MIALGTRPRPTRAESQSTAERGGAADQCSANIDHPRITEEADNEGILSFIRQIGVISVKSLRFEKFDLFTKRLSN
jgi:hypothetical protein